MAMIDPGQPIPLYFQLKTLLLEAMFRGEYGPGDRLPTEFELCDQYGLSRTPVSRALTELAEEGVIIRHRRRGTFVNPHWVPRHGSELRIMVPEEGPWEGLVHKTAPDDITIDVVTVPRADQHHVLSHAVAEGQAPDVAIMESTWLAEFAAAGFLHRLEDLDEAWVKDEYEDDFLAPAVAASRYQGKTYSVAIAANVAGMWYRRRSLEKAGLEPPTNWSELRTVGQALQEAGMAHPIALPGGSKGEEATVYTLLAFLASNGVEALGRDGVLLDQRGTVQTLTLLRRLIDDDLLPAESVSYEWSRPVRLLARSRAAVSFGGSYEARTLAEAMRVPVDELEDRVGFLPVPAGPHGAPASLAGTMVAGIFRQTSQPERSLRLVQHLVAPEPLATLSTSTGRIPARQSAIDAAGPDHPLLSAGVRLLEKAVVRPVTPAYPRVSAQLQLMLEAVLTKRRTPTLAARQAAEVIGAITGLPIVSPSGGVVVGPWVESTRQDSRATARPSSRAATSGGRRRR